MLQDLSMKLKKAIRHNELNKYRFKSIKLWALRSKFLPAMFELNLVTSLTVFHMRSGSDGEKNKMHSRNGNGISPVPRRSVQPGIHQLKY